MTRWRLLETGARPGDWNMACDAALLAGAAAGGSVPTLRFYGWDPPAVSLGHHQADPEPAAAMRLLARGIECVRRPTGGRAVYHGGPVVELTYSVVAPIGAEGLGGGLADSCRRIHAAIADGLAELGAKVELAGGSHQAIRPLSQRACFAAWVPGEIVSDGRKLVGSAQRRSRRGLLQHGSIPLAGDQAILAEIWPGSLEPGSATTVSSAAGRPVGFEELSAAIAAAFESALGASFARGELSDEEERRLEALLPAPALA